MHAGIRVCPDALQRAGWHGGSMPKIKDAVSEFLAHKRIAITRYETLRSTRTRTRWREITVTTTCAGDGEHRFARVAAPVSVSA